MIKKNHFIGLFVVLFGLGLCTSHILHSRNDRSNRGGKIAGGTLGGAAGGALIGGIAGGAKGAGIGLGVGAAIGFITSAIATRHDNNPYYEADQLRANIKAIERALDALADDIDAKENEITEIEIIIKNNQAAVTAAQTKRDTLEKGNAGKKEIKAATKNLNTTKRDLKQAQSKKQKLVKKLDKLDAKREQFERSLKDYEQELQTIEPEAYKGGQK